MNQRVPQEGSQTLREANVLFQDCIKNLTLSAGDLAVKERSRELERDNGEERNQNELEEDTYLDLYKVKREYTGKDRDSFIGKTRFSILTDSSESQRRTTTSGAVPAETQIPSLKIISLLEGLVGCDAEFRLLEARKMTPFLMTEIGWILLSPSLDYLHLDGRSLHMLLFAIENFYWKDNPYHSSLHSANVAHMVGVFLRDFGLDTFLGDLEKVALFIAALGHDIAHPGRNNNFYIHTNSILVGSTSLN